ncbi:hypothetical protein KUA50_001925 [Segatella hominis]|uniref:hypothetical protein n=1 Tax=Segatella hominis TaxID=2518605 RepID=UPI002115456A|nr:hypothetical protein [Segatella hominis]WOZ81747.1 hypothetical protein KUA50_001925 [Segatella hominis]
MMKKENENQRFRIAFNGFRGGNKGSITSQPLSEYDKTIRYPWVHDAILQIRGEKPIRSINNHDATALAKAQQRIKSQLPFRSAHYYQFKDNKRRQANIIPESFLFQTTIDVDEKELVEKALERAKLLDSLDLIPDDTGEQGATAAAGGSNDETGNRAAAGGSDAENENRAASGGSNDETENRTAVGGSDAENENSAAAGGSDDETGNRTAAVGNHDGDEAVTADQKIEKGQRNPEKGQRNPENGQKNPWKGMLLHLEYSARKKLHIDIRMPIGMTIEETQRAYCQALGVPCDESCFSPERIIFMTDADSEIYRSSDWYALLPEDEINLRREAFRKRGLDIDGRALKQGTFSSSFVHSSGNPSLSGSSQSSGKAPLSGSSQSSGNPSLSEKTSQNQKHSNSENHDNQPLLSGDKTGEKQPAVGGAQVPPHPAPHPADSHTSTGVGSAPAHPDGSHHGNDKNLIAFDLFRAQAGLAEVDINAVGSRHSSLLAIMSAGASRMMGEEELRRVVEQRMPAFAQERDCQQLISDFYARYHDSCKPMSREVIRINAQAERLGSKEMAQQNQEEDYPAPPPMPEKLPALIALLVSRTPEVYKPAVAHAVFPSLATHLWKTRFKYIDNVEHEATLMTCLLAGTGAGKSCVQMPISYVMEDIRKRDRENLAREKAWKDEVTRKGANKDKRKRPENLVIQEIDADMTNPAFVMRTAEAQEHFLYTSLNEIDQFDALRGQGNQQFRIMCLAFDPANQYGQTRVGTSSVTERVTIRFNWNASTTIQKGLRYFSRVLTDGPISRINFCTIPEREIGAEMPVYGYYGDDFREALRPYIENLCKTSGLVECDQAFQLALKLKEENADFARMTQNRIYENLSFRANVIAYLKACVLYVANGCKWEPEMDEFIRWSLRYDLYCKMRFFGDAIAKAEDGGVKSSRRGPANLLQLLPDEFSYQEAMAIRLEYGLGQKGTRVMINNWVHRGYIERKSFQSASQAKTDVNFSNVSFENTYFIKLKYRKDGINIEKNC